MATQEEQIAILTENLSALENESRRLLRAIQWSSKVRLILFAGLLLFALLSAFMFYRLYNEIKHNRIAKIQQIVAEQPEKFMQPMTQQIMALAEKEGPYIADVFQSQIEKDSKLYFEALENEQATLVTNLQSQLEDKVLQSYATMLDKQEGMLKDEFPELKDPEKLKNLRANMETVYEKIGKRYYVDFLKEELEELTVKLEKFPRSEPRQSSTRVSEQVATEFLELVRMMLVHSDHYVVPVKKTVARQPARTPAKNAETTKPETTETETTEADGVDLPEPAKPDEDK